MAVAAKEWKHKKMLHSRLSPGYNAKRRSVITTKRNRQNTAVSVPEVAGIHGYLFFGAIRVETVGEYGLYVRRPVKCITLMASYLRHQLAVFKEYASSIPKPPVFVFLQEFSFSPAICPLVYSCGEHQGSIPTKKMSLILTVTVALSFSLLVTLS
ncbi:hypothetical protein AVEN_253003-1 [Araneus ventricosus]|uniref:Uncharacterized protein n=1 Tax=Araneus ventricosus TaxID=182803 RepID=A0A4Y2F184_ARAVE|nr:hypothetical protein AVEN_253003-1 [Araneus ventricosus]